MAAGKRAGKIGRNAACPCGSGRKYKRCCLLRAQQQSPEARSWQRLARAHTALAGGLHQFAESNLHPQLIREATAAFFVWSEARRALRGEGLESVLDDWILHGFVAEPLELRPEDLDVPDGTVAERYLHQAGGRLRELERELLEASRRRGYSLLALRGADPEALRLDVHDLLTGEDLALLHGERLEATPVGAVLYGRVVTADGASHLAAVSPLALPPGDQLRILDWREALTGGAAALAPEALREVDLEVRELYLDLLLEPEPAQPDASAAPAVEPLRFALGASPEDALADLGAGPQDLSSAVHDDATGELRHAVLVLREPLTATLEIDGVHGVLLVRAEDPARVEELRETVEKIWLPGQVMLLGRGLEEPEEIRDGQGGVDVPPDRAALAPASWPPSWPEWVDAVHPALHERSPREAATTPHGRERVHALLAALRFAAEAESRDIGTDLEWVRREIGLVP